MSTTTAVLAMLRSATGFALRRQAPAPRFSSHGGRSSPACSCTTRRMYSGGTNESKSTMADDIKRTIASFCEKTGWKGKDLLFGCIAGTLMRTYKYNVTEKGILGYRFDEARKEREERKQREEANKNNIDISFC